MIRVRLGKDRGYFDHGWLKSYHSFSFSEYQDPNHVHFGPLRVINEDWIMGGEGFPTHGHKDMEIITYVIEGALQHKDSTGAEGVIRPGMIQKMSAGSGVRHSEFNALQDQETHLFQIWIIPNKNGIPASYIDKDFTADLNTHQPVLITGGGRGDNSVIPIQQDASVWVKRFPISSELDQWNIKSTRERLSYIQILKGNAAINISDQSFELKAGDALMLDPQQDEKMNVLAHSGAEVMWFDLPRAIN